MYRYLAIANYEDRFVIPTSHRELAEDAFPERNGCGFTFGDGCHGSIRNSTCLTAGGSTPSTSAACVSMGGRVMRILKVIGLLLEYPDELLWENRDDALALIRADVPS